jgi:hypothetical protein
MVFRAFAVAIMVSVLALWGVGAAAGAPRSASAASRASGPLVQTDKGPVIGFAKNGVDEFLGIPYAASPVGPLRQCRLAKVDHGPGVASVSGVSPAQPVPGRHDRRL